MSVIWSGVTAEGAVVPVQVTAEGKVVAVGEGPVGDYLPITGGDLTGDLTLGTDKIELKTDGSITAAGSATFAGDVTSEDAIKAGVVYDNVYLQAGKGDGTDPSKLLISARPGAGINDNVLAINTYPNTGTNKTQVFAVTYAGNVTAAGTIGLYLEADDDTKYTATTDAEGNETRVYNGAVLDVKALLLTLQTAATRIATLEDKVQTLETKG